MQQNKKRWIRLLLLTGAIFLVGMVLFILAKLGHPFPCLFYKLTGLSCPGCGNTRAVLAVLRLDMIGALRYNRMFPVCIFYLMFVYIRSCVTYLKTGRFTYHSPFPVMDIIILVTLLLWCVVRNVLHI